MINVCQEQDCCFYTDLLIWVKKKKFKISKASINQSKVKSDAKIYPKHKIKSLSAYTNEKQHQKQSDRIQNQTYQRCTKQEDLSGGPSAPSGSVSTPSPSQTKIQPNKQTLDHKTTSVKNPQIKFLQNYLERERRERVTLT